MYEPQELQPTQRGVIREDMYAPALGIVVGGTVATIGLLSTANRLRKGEDLKSRASMGLIGGFVAIISFAQADQLVSRMAHEETTQGWLTQ